MTMNELPVVFLLITGVGIWTGFEGRPDGAVGVLWLALWAYVILGFVWVQVRARTARRALENALRAGLGESWRRESDLPMVRGRDTASRWLRGILLPFERRRAGVERVRDLAYGPDPAHRLDLYRSRSTADGPRPILIQFHEGGFVQGGKSREAVTLLNQLAAHGWLCLSADYRLREAATWPNPLIDAKRAIAWAREHAREHDADPDQVFLAGGSAGGHMALNAVLTPDDDRFQPGFEDADTSVTAAVSLYGYLGGRSSDPASSPVALAGPDAPPMLLVQGGNDTGLGVPVSTAREWARELRAGSDEPVVHAELPAAQHAFDLFASVRARTTADAVEDFLAWARSQSATGSAGRQH